MERILLNPAFLQAVRATRIDADEVTDKVADLPFLFGGNYVSANAGSQLHFWSRDGFKPKIIDAELAAAQKLGINTLRVFLHDLHFAHDPRGFKSRIDEFLSITAAHGIKPMFTIFDSCWDQPVLGKYADPKPSTHNPSWVQSPGSAILKSPVLFAELQPYVEWVMEEIVSDPRSLPIADLWNEPDNEGGRATGEGVQKNRSPIVAPLLLQVFAWARKANPDIVLTSGIWNGGACRQAELEGCLNETEIVQRACSDLPSFHSYCSPCEFADRIDWLETDDEGNKRPVLCSEWMQRGDFQPGSSNTIENLLPLQRDRLMGSMMWGLFSGATQTDVPWSNFVTGIPHHDLFGRDGKLYYPQEGGADYKN